jgi:hypothetical protein
MQVMDAISHSKANVSPYRPSQIAVPLKVYKNQPRILLEG